MLLVDILINGNTGDSGRTFSSVNSISSNSLKIIQVSKNGIRNQP